MAMKSWDDQTTGEKLDTLRQKVDQLNGRLERLENGIAIYSQQVKKQFDDILEEIKNIRKVS